MKKVIKAGTHELTVHYVPIESLHPAPYNPRRWDKSAAEQLETGILKFGFVDPLVVNCAPGRENIIIGGHFRWEIAKKIDLKTVPVVFVSVPDIEKECELNLRLNRNVGTWSLDLLAAFDENLLKDVGFSSEEIDEVFGIDETQETFDLAKELKKLQIEKVEVQKGDIWQLGEHRLMCGDSTVEADVLTLMGNEKANMVMTDPPYRLEYLKGKRRDGKSTTGFGMKKNRRYLETDSLPEDFTRCWMDNISKVQAKDFSIICYENWKNLREI